MSSSIDPSAEVRNLEFCAFDVETTGLSYYSRVLELGAVRFRHGGPPRFFNTLLKSGAPIQPGARAIHGIEDGMLACAPPSDLAIRDFLDFSDGCILVAHNASFDTAALSREMAILGIRPQGHPVLDSLPLARKYFKTQDFKLATLAEHLALPLDRLHRALPDAFAVHRIIEEILKLDPGLPRASLASLAGLCGGVREIDPSRFLATASGLEALKAAFLPAFDSDSVVRISYAGGSKGAGLRPVRPIKIVKRHGVEYLDAYCLIDNRRKFFRLDLINDIL